MSRNCADDSLTVRLRPGAGIASLTSVFAAPTGRSLRLLSFFVVFLFLGATAQAQSIFTIAGGGTDDGRPATSVGLSNPRSPGIDAEGNLYIADNLHHRIRKVEARNGIITTVAGNGSAEYVGDGGVATAAGLNDPSGVALDSEGNLYIADSQNVRIRRVAAASGIITTVAGYYIYGQGNYPFTDGGYSGDGGPAIAAELSYPYGLAVDSAGNILIADSGNHRIRKVAAGSGIITTVAGDGSLGLSGDGAAATAAGLTALGVTLDPAGNLYITGSNRVRAVFACVTVNATELSSPADGSSGVATSPRLTWNAATGAFRHDVLLDTVNPPLKVAVEDVTTPSFSPANLDPLTTYYWQVIAKGDPFCTPPSKASSEVRSFTTAGGCRGPAVPEGVLP